MPVLHDLWKPEKKDMRLLILTAMMLLAASMTAAVAGEALNFEDETTRINYSLGYQIGGDFKRQGVEMRPEAVVKGIEDALSGADPGMKPAEMQSTLMDLKRKIVADQRAKRREAAQQQIEADKKFLEENAKKEGVITAESGLQYRILKEGTGKLPGPNDQVTVNYRGTLVNGQEFDSSEPGKPATFALNGVIKGWTEGLQHVKEGGKVELVVPPDLAYGSRGPLANRTLIFDVELVSVGQKEDPPVAKADQGQGNTGAQTTR